MAEFKALIGNSELLMNTADSLAPDIREVENDRYHVVHDGQSRVVSQIQVNLSDKSVELCLDNKTYLVYLADKQDLMVRQMGLNKSTEQGERQLTAPMPGLVLETMVEQGQTVVEGDHLLILEAMKMENVIKADRDGMIEEIFVCKGDKVEKGQILIHIISG